MLYKRSPCTDNERHAGNAFGADIIVTRDIAGFKKLPIKAMSPAEFAKTYIPESDDGDGEDE